MPMIPRGDLVCRTYLYLRPTHCRLAVLTRASGPLQLLAAKDQVMSGDDVDH